MIKIHHIPIIEKTPNKTMEEQLANGNEIITPLLSKLENHGEEEEENSPIKQVALTVPTTDDPTLPVFTFRMWILGIISCALLSFLNQFFWYRTEPLIITAISAQVVVLLLGKLMAAEITPRVFLKGSRFEFTLNPGPFNIKEHVLITIFANSGSNTPYIIEVVTGVKVFYKQNMTFSVSLIVVLMTQLMGFGWAGIFRRYLVEPAAMWWPSNLVQVSLFRALHEKEDRPKGGLTRSQFFVISFICSFAYYVFPGYLFQMLMSLSWICWIAPKSVLAHQLGSGLHGLGLGALGLDWSTISAYLGSPLASPWFATANVAAGFFLVTYVLNPLCYWFNVFDAKTFPIFSNEIFTSSGEIYNISRITDSSFHFDGVAYDEQGPLHLSTFLAMTYGVMFAAVSATFVHVLLFHGREIWDLRKSSFQLKEMDIHTKLMRNYKQVPDWWFVCILLGSISFTIFACEYFNEQLQLPWWGVLLACAISILFTLPVGIIMAVTNQVPYLIVITEYIIGYTYPGYPVANMCFKIFGYISVTQAITFLQDFKLGHYMKIPPRSMFIAQVLGILVSALVYLGTAWWLMEAIPDICFPTTSNSVWTCPTDHVFYDASVMWGLIGPSRIFGDGDYGVVNWFFLGGAIAPLLVWIAHKSFPNHEWITLINMPVLLAAAGMMPPATAVNYTTWIVVGFLSGFVVYRYWPEFWQRHNYVLSGALDAGLAFMGVLLYICLGVTNIRIDWWGNDLDGCAYASCPTAKGVSVEGCPVY